MSSRPLPQAKRSSPRKKASVRSAAQRARRQRAMRARGRG